MIFMPPRYGRFDLDTAKFSPSQIHKALEFARSSYFQSFEIKRAGQLFEVWSNEIAFDKFIEGLSLATGKSKAELELTIKFETLKNDNQT
jgi:hypothetical protein